MPEPRSIAVITVNYNSGEFLADLFESLRAQTLPPHEVILVDNASTDGSVAMVRARFPEVRIIEAGANIGFAAANNLGVRQSTGEYIALINSDARADARWLESLAAALDANPNAAAVQGKIYVAGEEKLIDQAGGMFNNIGNYWGRGHLDVDRGQYETDCEVAGVTACAMMLRRASLGDEDLFDSDLFMYGEELDLTLRLRGAGWSILYTPLAVAYHVGMASIHKAQKDARLFQQLHANRNRLKVVARRYPRSLLLRSTLGLALGLLYYHAFFLSRGGPRVFLGAVISQVKAIRVGMRARTARDVEAAKKWLPWMTTHSIRDMFTVRRQMQRRG